MTQNNKRFWADRVGEIGQDNTDNPLVKGEKALLDPDMPEQELRLHMGELTASEVLVASAAIAWANTRADHIAEPSKMVEVDIEKMKVKLAYPEYGGACEGAYLLNEKIKYHNWQLDLMKKQGYKITKGATDENKR